MIREPIPHILIFENYPPRFGRTGKIDVVELGDVGEEGGFEDGEGGAAVGGTGGRSHFIMLLSKLGKIFLRDIIGVNIGSHYCMVILLVILSWVVVQLH